MNWRKRLDDEVTLLNTSGKANDDGLDYQWWGRVEGLDLDEMIDWVESMENDRARALVAIAKVFGVSFFEAEDFVDWCAAQVFSGMA